MNRKRIISLLFLMSIMYYCSLTRIISSNDMEQVLIRKILDDQQQIIYEDIAYDDSHFFVNPENEPAPLLDNKKEMSTEKVQEIPNGYDCVIEIPSINLEKIVYTGNGRELQLEKYNLVTAAADMKYKNGGNYIICGHDSQLYGHSLNRLDDVEIGDLVYIYYNGKTYTYRIVTKDYECMSNTSAFCEQSEKRQVTIISCAKNIGPDQYIVISCELKKIELYE